MAASHLLVVAAAASTLGRVTTSSVSFTRSEGGDACTTASGQPGACSDIRECPSVRKTFRTERPTICSFQGHHPIVCCPDSEGVATSSGNASSSTPSVDVSSPQITFECGVSRPRIVRRPLDSSRRRRRAEDGGPHHLALRSKRFVVGGKDSKVDAWPWMALVGKLTAEGTSWFCGGVLINEQWVLSALHCFFHNKPEVVRLGEHDYSDDSDGAPHRDFKVADLVTYPDYTPPAGYHDLALLRLETEAKITRSIRPVCLPWGAESKGDIIGDTATLTGWGDTLFGGIPSSTLQEVNVTVFPSTQCDSSYSALPNYADTWPRGIGPETLCAGDPAGGRDACQGDSGGPLVTKDSRRRYVLAGVVSQGFGCGDQDYPGLYANARHPPYLAWIKRVAFHTP